MHDEKIYLGVRVPVKNYFVKNWDYDSGPPCTMHGPRPKTNIKIHKRVQSSA